MRVSYTVRSSLASQPHFPVKERKKRRKTEKCEQKKYDWLVIRARVYVDADKMLTANMMASSRSLSKSQYNTMP